MKKRKPTNWRVEYRKEARAHQQAVHELTAKIRRLQAKLNSFEAHERWAQREKEANWALYDRAVDETTQHERVLFAASPAYQKYQQWRHGSHHAEENKRVDAIKYLHARGHLASGDWMAP